MINSFVKRIAAHFLTQADLKSLVLADDQQTQIANTLAFINRTSKEAIKNSSAYVALKYAVEAFVVKAHGANSFAQMCRSYVRDNSTTDYYLIAAIGSVITAYQMEAGTLAKSPGGEAGHLIAAINTTIREAKDVKNYIKRRALVSSAVKTELPGIDAGRAATITELLLQLS